jgi:hypothetical protein
MNPVEGDYFIDCSICQSIFTNWGFRRLVQDHDTIHKTWRDEYLHNECVNSAFLSSLINLTNHKFHNTSVCIWHVVIDLGSLQCAREVNGHPEIVISDRHVTYDIKEKVAVFICRNGFHFFTVLIENASETTYNKWVVYVYDSLETTATVKKLELNHLFLKFNIPPEKINVKIANSQKQMDGSSCGFYSYFYLFKCVCNNMTDILMCDSLLQNSKTDSDSAMRKFCAQQYDDMFQQYKSSLINFGGKIERRQNFLKYGCLVGRSVDGNIVKYYERRSEELWSYALKKETPTLSTNILTISLFEALQLIKENQPALDTSLLDVLSVKKFDESNYRFNIKVVQDLSLDMGDNTYLVNSSKDLILKWFEPRDRIKLHKMFSMVPNVKCRYMMVSLFGSTCLNWRMKHPGIHGETKCIGTLIGINSYMGLYISHLAVSSDTYSKGVFGNTADQKTFRKRGIAGVLLCIAQSLSKVYNDSPNIFSWSYNANRCKENKHCCWTLMGFKDADTSNTNEWPIELSYLIEHFTLYCEENYQQFERLTPMITKDNLKFSLNTETCSDYSPGINEEKIVNQWPTQSCEPSNCGDVMKYLQKSFDNIILTDIPTHLKTKYGILEERKKNIVRKYCQLDYLSESQGIPDIAVDYFGFLFMIQFDNVYIMSLEFSDKCLNSGCIHQSSSDDHEMLLLMEEAHNRNVMYLFPFLDNFETMHGSWSFVLVRWIESELFFFYCTSFADNNIKYSSDVAKKVPRNIISLFMNSPFWSVKETANWVNVPSMTFKGCDNKCLIFLSMYMLIMSKSPHKAIYLLHHLPEYNKSRIDKLNKGWISFILYFKCWFVPIWLKNVMKKDSNHQYSISWCNKKTKRIFLDEETYQQYHITENFTGQVKDLTYNVESLELCATKEVGSKTPFQNKQWHETEDAKLPKLLPPVVETTKVNNNQVPTAEKPKLVPLKKRPYQDYWYTVTTNSSSKTTAKMQSLLPLSEDNRQQSRQLSSLPPLTTEEKVIIDRFFSASMETRNSLIYGHSRNTATKIAESKAPFNIQTPMIEEEKFSSLLPSETTAEMSSIASAFKLPLYEHQQQKLLILPENTFGDFTIAKIASSKLSSNSQAEDAHVPILSSELSCTAELNTVKFGTSSLPLPLVADEASLQHQQQSIPCQLHSDKKLKTAAKAPQNHSISSLPIKRNRRYLFFHNMSNLLLLFRETIKLHSTSKSNSNTTIDVDLPNCSICGWGVLNSTTCVECKVPLHFNCGFKVKVEKAIVFLCGKCGKGKKRLLNEPLKDSTLSSQWFPSERHKKTEEPTVIETKEERMLLFYEDFYSWLASIDEIVFFKRAEALSFYGRNKKIKRIRKIEIILLRDVLLEFFPIVWKKFIQGKERKWFPLPKKLKAFIHSYGRCFANSENLELFEQCFKNDWTYLKFNCKSNQPSFICDCQQDVDIDEHAAYISFTNNVQSGAEIQFVPLYYLHVWLYVCEEKTVFGEKNELLNIINQARNQNNKWIQIPEGLGKKNTSFDSFDKGNTRPVSFRVQPHWEYSCVFNSIMNAFHYINDYQARNEIFENMAVSLDYTKMSAVCHSRSSFAAYIVNHNLQGYKVIKLRGDFDILQDRSMWPTLCVLESSSNVIMHAITTVENYIFDSNLSTAIELTRDNLDWCCSSDFTKGEFKRVHAAYRFFKPKPTSNLLLRSCEQKNRGLSSIIQSFFHVQDIYTAKALDKFRCEMKNEVCLISQVRDLVRRKEFGYRPLVLKSIDDIFLKGNNQPSIFLVGISTSFCYEVLSSVGNYLYDGRHSYSLCKENIYNALQIDSMKSTKNGSFEFIFGYTFLKNRKSK